MLTMPFVTSLKKTLNNLYATILTSLSQLAYTVRYRICKGKVVGSSSVDAIPSNDFFFNSKIFKENFKVERFISDLPINSKLEINEI